MSFGTLSEASHVAICSALLLRIKAEVLRQKAFFCVITCASRSRLSAPLYSFFSLEPQTGIHLSLSVNISQCFAALNPHDLVPLQLRSQARGSGRGHPVVIAVTRLSASSTCLGSVFRSSHQASLFEFCTGCIHTWTTEAYSWQLELRANRRRAQRSVSAMQPGSPSNG